MDIVPMARQFSVVFLVLALVFGSIAAGILAPPASGTVGGQAKTFATGGNVESAVWSYNPHSKTWHFELIAGANAYEMLINFSQQRVEGADGAYEASPYSLSIDLSDVYYALPMQKDPSKTVYRYKFVDCGTYRLPNMAVRDVISTIAGIGGGFVGVAVSDFFVSETVKKEYAKAYSQCKDIVDDAVRSIHSHDVSSILFLSTDRVIDRFEIWPMRFDSEYDAPHFYGVIRYAVDTWVPKSIGQLYPIGTVGVSIRGQNGTDSVRITLPGTSIGTSTGETTSPISARLPVGDGYIRYVGYLESTGDVYGLDSPWVINHEGQYVTVESSDLQYYYSVSRGLDRYFSEGAAGDYVVESQYSLRQFMENISRRGLNAEFARESKSIREEIKRRVTSAETSFQNVVKNNKWEQYIVEKDVQSYGYLKLKPPMSNATAFKLKLIGDVDADWIGLRALPAKGKIVGIPSTHVPVSRDGGVSFTFTVKNVGESDGAFDWKVQCDDLGTIGAGTTTTVRKGSTLTVPVHGYLAGLQNLSEEKVLECTITVTNLFADYEDTARVFLKYTPDVVCQYTMPMCGVQNGVEGYFYCDTPYKQALFVPCPSGKVCKMTEQGARCVAPPTIDKNGWAIQDGDSGSSGTRGEDGEKNTRYCDGDKLCRIVNGNTICEQCPNGGTCNYVADEGARCVGEEIIPPSPVPDPVDIIPITPASGTVELWRVGSVLAALGSLVVWIALM